AGRRLARGGKLLKLWRTLLAARGGSGRLPVALGVLGRHAGARSMARTDAVWNSFFCGFSCARLRARDAFLLPRRLHAVESLRRSPQAVRLQVHAGVSSSVDRSLDPRSRAVGV